MMHEVYLVQTKGKGSRLLVFQDWPGDGESRSREGVAAKANRRPSVPRRSGHSS